MIVQKDRARRALARDRHVRRRRRRSRASSPTARASSSRAADVARRSRDGLIVANDAFTRRDGLRPADRGAAAARARPPSSGCAAVQRAHARSARSWPASRPSRSPTASGSCAAASRDDDERLPRARRRRRARLRRRHQGDDRRPSPPPARAGRDHARRARPRAPRPPRHRAGARRAGLLPPRRKADAEGDGGMHYFDLVQARAADADR